MKAGLARDVRGAAAVEFALIAALLTGVFLVSVDLALYVTRQGRLGSAVQQAAIIVFSQRNDGPVDRVALADFVGKADGSMTSVTTTVTCNGSEQSCATAVASRACACVAGEGRFTVAACGATCSSGATAGYFVTISATAPFDPIIRGLVTPQNQVAQAVTARLQ